MNLLDVSSTLGELVGFFVIGYIVWLCYKHYKKHKKVD